MSTVPVSYESLHKSLDPRTLEILERRRSGATVKRRGWLMRRMLLASDLVGLCVSFAAAQWIYETNRNGGHVGLVAEVGLFVATLPIWVVMAKLYGLYDRDEERADHSTADEVLGVFHLVTVGTWLLFAGSYITRLASPQLPKLLTFWALAVVAIPLFRSGARAWCRRSVHYLQNTIVVGAGEVGQQIARKILEHPEYGLNLVGFVDGQPKERVAGLEHLAVLDELDDVPVLVRLLDVERVIFAFSNDGLQETLALIRQLRGLDVQIDIVPRFFASLGPKAVLHSIEGVQLVALPPVRLSWSLSLLKRLRDVVIAMIAIVVLSPLMLIISIAVLAESGWPLIYRRRVLGRGGMEFDAFKFRTMRRELCIGERYGGEQAGEVLRDILADPKRHREYSLRHKLEDDPRTTRVGRWLRLTSVDELPQLFNVMRGEMSIVGPRMITTEELSRYGSDGELIAGASASSRLFPPPTVLMFAACSSSSVRRNA